MGPRFFKRGDRNRLSRLFMVVIASMGPRFFKRGDQSGDVAIGQNDFASMGPRFFKRGDTSRPVPGPVMRPSLQWGHASLSVETPGELLVGPAPPVASMGPRFFKRGDRPDVPVCPYRTRNRFNGATLL